MGLSNLTKAAIESALAEFDEIGREAFLDKYGFKEARAYFIERGGKRYDSKAIAGAAHGYARSDLGPLQPIQFNGGEATVKPVMERLGFSVVNTNPRNPDWCRDELILALNFYLKHRARLPGTESIPRVVYFGCKALL